MPNLIGIGEITMFEIHRNKTTIKSPNKMKRTIFRSSLTELRRWLSGKA
jgi:hypothetical protein